MMVPKAGDRNDSSENDRPGFVPSVLMRGRLTLLALFLAFSMLACEEKVEHYRIAKELSGAGGSSSPVQPSGPGSLKFKLPPGWQPKPADAMRKASFGVTGGGGAEVDISVTSFPGDTGGLLANVNRWRGQLSLPPVREAELDALAEKQALGGKEFVLVDFVEHGKRITGAMHPRAGETWFFKMMGDDKLTAAQRPAFAEFLASVQFE